MKLISSRGFTLVEMMVVIMIIGILATTVYILVAPYIARSRDTKRVTDILGYTNILDTYDKNFDTFPSNMGSWGSFASPWYCLTELYTRWVDHWDNPNIFPVAAGKFGSLVKDTSAPPVDPTGQIAYEPLCPMLGSYVYSRFDYGTNNEKQIALIAAKLEIRSSGNYGTGDDLIDRSKVQGIIDARKSTIPDGALDQLYVVSKLQ